jgi:hypothetical protein
VAEVVVPASQVLRQGVKDVRLQHVLMDLFSDPRNASLQPEQRTKLRS